MFPHNNEINRLKNISIPLSSGLIYRGLRWRVSHKDSKKFLSGTLKMDPLLLEARSVLVTFVSSFFIYPWHRIRTFSILPFSRPSQLCDHSQSSYLLYIK